MSGSSAPAWNLLRGLPDDPAVLQQLRQASVDACRATVEAAGVHLGPEATGRAYELVAMGLIYEKILWAGAFRKQAEARRKPGRPPKDVLIDEDRARLLLRLKSDGCRQKRIKDWVAFATESEEHLVKDEIFTKEDCIFAYSGAPVTLAQSVSRGLRELGLTAKHLR